jgi:hypothetical protein
VKDIAKNKTFQADAAAKLQEAMDLEIAENELQLQEVKINFGGTK